MTTQLGRAWALPSRRLASAGQSAVCSLTSPAHPGGDLAPPEALLAELGGVRECPPTQVAQNGIPPRVFPAFYNGRGSPWRLSPFSDLGDGLLGDGDGMIVTTEPF